MYSTGNPPISYLSVGQNISSVLIVFGSAVTCTNSPHKEIIAVSGVESRNLSVVTEALNKGCG